MQIKHSLPRRKFTLLVDEGQIFVNGIPVESYKHEIKYGEKLIIKTGKYRINETIKISSKKSESVIVLFNKPK
ncbi:hypothetical protein KKG31_04015 [Patescibacteria group bacterium]|nr:hypothetical protein [Patescibacteria group bacterium]MBU1758308.1 hypothetical protein [Patescibacteria group bacterium]